MRLSSIETTTPTNRQGEKGERNSIEAEKEREREKKKREITLVRVVCALVRRKSRLVNSPQPSIKPVSVAVVVVLLLLADQTNARRKKTDRQTSQNRREKNLFLGCREAMEAERRPPCQTSSRHMLSFSSGRSISLCLDDDILDLRGAHKWGAIHHKKKRGTTIHARKHAYVFSPSLLLVFSLPMLVA